MWLQYKIQNSVIIYSLSSCFKPVWVSFFCWTQRKIFWRTIGTKQLFATIDFNSRKKSLWKSVVPHNCLVPIVLQNIFLCIQQKKEWTHWGLLQIEGEQRMTEFSFLGGVSLYFLLFLITFSSVQNCPKQSLGLR